MLTLPPECRGLFKEPFGSLYPDFSEITEELSARPFCCVGDVVTQNAFLYGLTPDVSVIDGVTKRSNVVTLPKFCGRTFSVNNPAGTITEELEETLRAAYAMRPSLVLVEGEEDLAVLPLIQMLPDSAVILYGQPDEGVVFCEVTSSLRQKAGELLACFVRS
ncbi:MAG: DUF359 domain-containing protein [Methanocorpusculum parvum]|nr:DUF359 domain-containing protein [Methanocorpusculum parvum]